MMMKNAASLTEGEHEFLTLHFVSFFSFFYRFSSALVSGWRFRRSRKSPVHLVIWSVISSICEALWQYDWSTLCEGKGSERSAGRTFIDCLNPEGDGSTFCSHPVCLSFPFMCCQENLRVIVSPRDTLACRLAEPGVLEDCLGSQDQFLEVISVHVGFL